MDSAVLEITPGRVKSKHWVTAEAAGIIHRPELPLNKDHFDILFQQLMDTVNWQEDFYTAFGRRFDIPRLQAWYADGGLKYRYADNLLSSQNWIAPLVQLRQLIENLTQTKFNAVLATCYRNGHDNVGWHSDDEKELGSSPLIASLSLGAARRFEFRNKNRNKAGSILLQHGDLILMSPKFQHHWQHQVPAEPQITATRINLTFRQVYSPPLNVIEK